MRDYELSVSFSCVVSAKNHYQAKQDFIEILQEAINDTVNDFSEKIELKSFNVNED